MASASLCNSPNATNITNLDNVNRVSNTTRTNTLDIASDPLLYIVTVLMFYALSMTILMVKYIRREKQEAEFSHYYYEYVSRDKFHTPQYENSEKVKHVMRVISESREGNSDRGVFDNADTEHLIPEEDPGTQQNNKGMGDECDNEVKFC